MLDTSVTRRRAGGVTALAKHQQGFAVVAGTLSTLLFSAALPAILVAHIPDVHRSQGWIPTLIVMIWAGLRMSLLWVSGRQRLFDFFLWLYTYIFLGLAPTVQIRSGLTATTTPDVSPRLDVWTGLIIWVGLLAYEAGRLVWMARESRRRVDPGETPAAVGSARALLLVLLGLATGAYFISKVGIGPTLGSRMAASAARSAAWSDSAVQSIMYALAIYPLLVATGALSQLARLATARTTRRFCVVLMIICCAVLLLIVNPISSARYTFGTVAFAILIYCGAAATRRRARLTMLGTILGFLFAFPLADAFRTSTASFQRNGFFGEYMGNPDYDSFWQIANALSYWRAGLVEPMRQFLGNLCFWVPRSVWPNKPEDTGILLAEYRGYHFNNLSAPLWAEFLVNGGIIALVIGFFLVGVLLRRFDSTLLPSFRHGGLWGIVGAIFPVYMTILLRGSLLQATGALMVSIACVIFVGIRVPGWSPEHSPPGRRARRARPTRQPR